MERLGKKRAHIIVNPIRSLPRLKSIKRNNNNTRLTHNTMENCRVFRRSLFHQ